MLYRDETSPANSMQADPTQKQTVDLHQTEKSCLGMRFGGRASFGLVALEGAVVMAGFKIPTFVDN